MDDAEGVPVTDEEQADTEKYLAEVIQGLVNAASGHRQVHKKPQAKCRKCVAILKGLQLLDDLESDGPPPVNGEPEPQPQLVEYESRAAS